jgi:copper oxidase (laccase) domain-containing protein
VGAALGPAIDDCCYEVGEDVVAALEAGAGAGLLHSSRRVGNKSWIDLRQLNIAILQQAGVPAANIHRVGPCTRCAADECFSHRASAGQAGRQLSAIAWR